MTNDEIKRLRHHMNTSSRPEAHVAQVIALCDEVLAARTKLTEVAITQNDKRWRILEHGCQWVSWTPIGGETRSFDPRDVRYLQQMRAWADETIEKHLAILRASIATKPVSPRTRTMADDIGEMIEKGAPGDSQTNR